MRTDNIPQSKSSSPVVDDYNNAKKNGTLDIYYFDENKKLAELIREIAGEKATRLIAKKLDVTTQAVNLRFPQKKKQKKQKKQRTS